VLTTSYILWSADSQSRSFDYFVPSILLTGLAIAIESLCEIYQVYMLLNKDLSVRVKAEGIAIFARSVLTWYLLTQNFHLLAYAISQLTFALILFALLPLLLQREESAKKAYKKKGDHESEAPR
jgi:hypothetical protein